MEQDINDTEIVILYNKNKNKNKTKNTHTHNKINNNNNFFLKTRKTKNKGDEKKNATSTAASFTTSARVKSLRGSFSSIFRGWQNVCTQNHNVVSELSGRW